VAQRRGHLLVRDSFGPPQHQYGPMAGTILAEAVTGRPWGLPKVEGYEFLSGGRGGASRGAKQCV